MLNKNSTRYYSDKQEKQIAKHLKGKQTSNSGATSFVKGDVLLDDWLIEAKTSVKESESFKIHKQWLLKNKEEAFAMRKHYNAVAINFGGKDNYYIIDEHTFKELIELLQEN